MAARRPAAPIVAGRLGGGRLQPRRADAGDRRRTGPRRAVGRVDQEGASGADGPGGGDVRLSPRSQPFASARTAASSPRARRRRTTSRCGTPRAAGDRPADHHQPAGTGGAQSIAFSPDSKRIAVPGAPGTVGIWEVATGRRVGEPLEIGSADVEAAIFADGGRTLIASDDSGSVSMVDVANGTTDPPAALGRRRACRLAGSQPGRTAAGRGFVRRAGLRVGHEDRRAVRLAAHGRHEPGQRRRVQPRRPDPGELAPAFGGRLEHERRTGDRRAAGRPDRPDHRRVLQPRRQAARRGAVRRRHDRLRHGDPTTGSPDRRRLGRHRGRLPTPTGSSSPSERSTARCGSSIRRAGRPSAPARRREARAVWQVAFSPDGRLLAVAVDPNGVDGFYDQQRQGEVQLWDVDSRSRVGERSRRAPDRCSPWPSTATARCSRPAATPGGSTCGTWPPRPAMASR